MTARLSRILLAARVRPVFAVSLAASVVLHVAALAWLGYTKAGPIGVEALAAAAETVLTFRDPPAPPTPEVVPPEPESAPEPEPEAQAPPPAAELTTLPPEKIPLAAPAPAPAPPRPKPAPPAPPPRPAAIPQAPPPKNTVFAGVQARRASRIVYVVDASGPMASSLAFVKNELARSVGMLQADQSFQVLFFRENAGPEGRIAGSFAAFGTTSASPQLSPATPETKKQFQGWLESIRPSGRSNPQPALEEALRLGPDLVFVLSRRIKRTNLADAAGEVRQIVAALDRLNPADGATGKRPVVIKTIQFLDDDPSGLLQTIAQVHGDGAGSYRLLTIDQLPRK